MNDQLLLQIRPVEHCLLTPRGENTKKTGEIDFFDFSSHFLTIGIFT